jgi:hypothetical protein
MLHEAVREVKTVRQTVKICANITDSTYTLEIKSGMQINGNIRGVMVEIQ